MTIPQKFTQARRRFRDRVNIRDADGTETLPLRIGDQRSPRLDGVCCQKSRSA